MTPATLDPALSASKDERRVTRVRPELVTVLSTFALSALLIVASRFVSPALGSWGQAATVVSLSSFLIVAAFGQGLVILVGGLDLSVASLITLSAVLCTTWVGPEAGAAGILLIPAILVVCALIGAVSGLGITVLGIPPFIMTMATGIIVAAGALGYTSGTPRGSAPAPLLALMKGEVAGIPLLLIFTAAFVIAAAVLQQATGFGRRLYAVGASARAAFVAGVPVTRTVVAAYMLSATASGVAGLMLVGYSDGATLRMGDSYLLPTIAAVVVGGSSILGGSGSFVATVGGAVLLTTLGTVIAALGIGQGWRTVIEGSIILIALLLLRENTFARIRSWFPR
ncbi:ABC transporter permease [Methylobacterium terricola]|uniref:Autoinducer 2 import system permease protein LsrD n=1 Tax=Methylobacterium terricola TaxID=2583531 RepID=A0A5C4LKD4_9HYPH|nr:MULTISPECIES: ABC transporter permease [Methylobacterium]MCF4127678.1 ABC transporter permease [Methylobacterium sp. SyP6R]TNC14956.1 ABC transporter permease [Methylobacterium terricola]